MNSKHFSLYAHSTSNSSQNDWETLVDHLENVAAAARRNASGFGAEGLAHAAGLLHDLGKSKAEFQAYLRGERGSEPHSGEGARYACEHLGGQGKLLAYCIAGHHAGLPNGIGHSTAKPPTPLDERIRQAADLTLPNGIEIPALTEISTALAAVSTQESTLNFALHFFTRMLFSALVDADYLETERFYDQVKKCKSPRGSSTTLDDLGQPLDIHLAGFGPAEKPIDKLRSDVLSHVRAQASKPTGLFSLTVPTGGAKTLSSLAFAIDHARHHGLDRVIYVIPFTSIVEQTADVFRAALGDKDAVLEHHAAFDFGGLEDSTESEKLRLAAQNWDRPVIVTTAVQFFDSLFANRPSKCRKLHRLANSVIILDEAQTLPLRLLRPCLAALKELARGYGASIVFCTATQPALIMEDGFPAPEGLPKAKLRELAPNPRQLYQALRRVKVRHAGELDDGELTEKITAQNQVLVILNNRAHVRAVFDRLKDQAGAALLTTLMTAAHRRKVLAGIRQALLDTKPVRLIATSLIEAGVDIDFPQVWREVAGIDSIAQAAGRCNREGTCETADVFVFCTKEDFRPPADLAQFAQIGAEVLARHDDPLSLAAIHDYFQQLYWDRGPDALDSAQVGSTLGIMKALAEAGNQMDFPFADIAAAFRVIEQTSVPLIIQGGDWGIPADALRDLTSEGHAGTPAREFQPFLVQIPIYQRKQLLDAGAAEIWREADFGEQFILLTNNRLYDATAGFSPEDPEDLGDMIK